MADGMVLTFNDKQPTNCRMTTFALILNKINDNMDKFERGFYKSI